MYIGQIFQWFKLFSERLWTGTLRVCVVFAFILLSSLPALAENTAQVKAQSGEGYGRLIFIFDTMPNYKLEMLDGVLVVNFNEKVDVNVAEIADRISDYVIIARADPNKTAVRLALAQEIRINKIEAGEKLFIDLLPKNWKGAPPSLPEDVMDELAARAEEAAIAAQEKILQRELKKKKNQLLVRFGELPTFTRLFFDWKVKVETKMERNGKVITLRFNRYAKPIIKDLKTTPPKYLRKIDYNVTRTELVVNLTVAPNTDVRGFKEGMGFVVDLSSGDNEQIKRLNETIKDSDIAEQGGLVKSQIVDEQADEVDNGRNEIRFLADSKNENKPEILNKKLEPAKNENKPTPVVAEKLPDDVKKIASKANNPNVIKASESVEISVEKAEYDDEKPIKVNTDLPDNLSNKSLSDKLRGEQKSNAPEIKKNYKKIIADDEKIVVEAVRVNREYHIVFPFKEDVAIAAFERDKLFWLVFEKKIDFDISELEEIAPELIKVHDVRVIDNATTVRLKLNERLLSSIGARNSDWVLTIGELVLMNTKVLKLQREHKKNGHAIVQMNLKNAGKVHWFVDEALGDKIAVVTAKGPARGLLKTHNFVEFAALPTIHGLVFQALSDDLNVSSNFDQVVVSSRNGLSITVAKGDSSKFDILNVGNIRLPSSIEFMDIQTDAAKFIGRRAKLNKLIDIAENDKKRSIYRLEMVELLLSYQMPDEALGMLAFEKYKSPATANKARFKSLEGAALVLAGKYKQAMNTLSAVAIRKNRTTTMFRAYALAKTGAYQESLKEFGASIDLLAQLPPRMEADFLIAAIEAALNIPNLNVAQQHLIMLENVMETDHQKAKYWLLMAQSSRLNDEIGEAISRFEKSVEYDVRPITAEASGYLSVLKYQTGMIKIDEAIDQLNGNIVIWRGDEIEQKNSMNLGKLYMDKGDYREGLVMLKRVSSKFDDNEVGREAAQYMSEVFEALYLNGKASEMPPFKALSLFYDFRQLTPIGRRGDEMIRLLADRLIDVDLLDQAIELLEHQVNNRLDGIARADVASKLAMVQLLNYQPAKTIQTIAKSRTANMPKHIIRKRDLLEARALVEIGRIQSAITRLEGYSGRDVLVIRSEAYWRGGFWQQAGEEFEAMILNKWQGDTPLLDFERLILLRSAIAYKMANDTVSLARLRNQYIGKMENTAHAAPFNLVVDEDRTDAVGFRKLAREVAEIDMLKDFISDYRDNEAKDIRDRG